MDVHLSLYKTSIDISEWNRLGGSLFALKPCVHIGDGHALMRIYVEGRLVYYNHIRPSGGAEFDVWKMYWDFLVWTVDVVVSLAL